MDVYEEEEMLMISFVTSTSSLTTGAKSEEKGAVKMLTLRKKKGAFANLVKEMRISDREAHFR